MDKHLRVILATLGDIKLTRAQWCAADTRGTLEVHWDAEDNYVLRLRKRKENHEPHTP